MSHQIIGVDWGTTNMRAVLCDVDGSSISAREVKNGPGIARLQGSPADELFKTIAPWLQSRSPARVILSGMVGSNIGWHSVPYLSCPISVSEIAKQTFGFADRDIELKIVPGLRSSEDSDAAEVMRGEELQILGWLAANPIRQKGTHLLCLPGTHTKWATICDGVVESFVTAVSGELFSLLLNQSILFAGFSVNADNAEVDTAAFDLGVEQMKTHGGMFLHSLFGARSRQVLDTFSNNEARSYLSGLIIGSDVQGLLTEHKGAVGEIVIIGNPTQSELYDRVIRATGRNAVTMDGIDAALMGYKFVDEALTI